MSSCAQLLLDIFFVWESLFGLCSVDDVIRHSFACHKNLDISGKWWDIDLEKTNLNKIKIDWKTCCYTAPLKIVEFSSTSADNNLTILKIVILQNVYSAC